MMGSFGSNWIKNVFNTRPQDLDESIYRNIINILETPALLIDFHQSKILLCNAEFCKLTSFSQQDLINQPLEMILNTDYITGSAVDSPIFIEIQGRHKKNLGVYVKKKIIDPNGELILLLVIPENVFLSDRINTQEKFFTTFNQLLRLIEEENLTFALNKAISLIADFVQTDYVMVYQVRSEKPQLEKKYFFIAENVFPEHLVTRDLLLENSINIWIPGQRVTSELHKIARANGFAYLASTALGPGNSASAFLVIAHTSSQPPKNLSPVLEIFGSALASIFQYFILVSTLKKQIKDQKGKEILSDKIFSQSHEGIIIVDHQFNVVSINPSAEKLLCFSMHEAIGQPIENIIVGPSDFLEIKRKIEYENKPQIIERLDVHNRAGETINLDIKIHPVMNSGKNAYIIFIDDLSELEEYRLKTEQLEKHAKLGEVTAVFAHDVRNPINNISMGVQILARKYASDEQTNEITNRMIQDCDRLTALMESVLAYTKPFEPKFEKMNIGFLIDRVINRLRPKLQSSGITEYVQKPEIIPEIMADSRSLDQVFTNLITNAIDAMEQNQGGTLAIHIEETDEITNHPQIVVKVIDSGPGIPEEVRGKVFEPFITTKKRGTGLGLAICNRNITAHKGNITVHSFPGGTVFNVFLPIQQGD